MKKLVLLISLALGIVPAAAAQSAMILPDKPLRPADAHVRDAVYQVRDSMAAVTSAAARLRRDFRTTSPAVLTSRARELARACSAALRNVPPTREAVVGRKVDTKLEAAERVRLERALDAVEESLRQCDTDFTALSARGKGEEVRGYGNRRAETVVKRIVDYEEAARGYFSALRVPYSPRGAPPNPLAG